MGGADTGKKFENLQFTYVDESQDPQHHIEHLDAISSIPSMTGYKNRITELMNIHRGNTVLDVGCGTGDDLIALADRVGEAGLVTGIDSSLIMVETARSRTAGRPVECRLMDALQLGFPDGKFDAVRADRVLPCITEPARALGEMARVTRTGGMVVIAGTDWGSLIVPGDNRAVTRRILEFRGDSVVNGWLARKFPAMLRRGGLADIVIDAFSILVEDMQIADDIFGLTEAAEGAAASGLISAKAADRWIGDIVSSAARGDFIAVIIGIVAAGRKV